MAKELPTSIKLPSLEELELEGSGLEKAVLSWVGNHKDLKYLSLRGYEFSQSRLSWINNLTKASRLVYIDLQCLCTNTVSDWNFCLFNRPEAQYLLRLCAANTISYRQSYKVDIIDHYCFQSNTK